MLATRFDDPAALPETHGGTVDQAVLARAIEERGALLVRQLLPYDVIADLDRASVKVFQQMQLPEAEREPGWFEPPTDPGLRLGRTFVHTHGCSLMVDTPILLKQTLDAYKAHGIIDLVATHLGEAPVLSSQKATLRSTRPGLESTPAWHQDGMYMGGEVRVLNIWLALTACGEQAAGVELAAQRIPEVQEPDYLRGISPEKAARLSPVRVAPIFQPGDAVMFDHLCLHRTANGPHFTQERRALEMWFFAPSTFPHSFESHPVAI